jgi:hypothetical protein
MRGGSDDGSDGGTDGGSDDDSDAGSPCSGSDAGMVPIARGSRDDFGARSAVRSTSST